MRGNQKEVMSIETTLTYWVVFSLWFIQVGCGMLHTAQWCSVRHLDATIKASIRGYPGVEGSGRIDSFHSFLIKWLY